MGPRDWEPGAGRWLALTRLRDWGLMLTISLAIAGASDGIAGVKAVWAVSDGEKIAHDNLGSPLRKSNSVWDGNTIRLVAARNEIVAFQVVIEADASGIAGVSARLPELRIEGGDARIAYQPPTSDPTNFVGRPIHVYTVRDMFVKNPTAAPWIFVPGSPSAPKNPAGWQPVQLVPENARAGLGGFPVRVAPSTNQVFWFEIYTGRGRPSGRWRGTVSINADGNSRTVPLEMELLEFDLPDENSIRAMIFFEPNQLELYQGRRLDPEYHRFAHSNRVELVHAYDRYRVEAAIGRFTGEDFTAARGYEGPGEGVANKIVPRTFYGPGRDFDEKASAWKAADSWIEFLTARLPEVLTFVYLPDEPNPRQFPYIRRLGENLHSNPGPGRKLGTMVTRRYTPEIEEAIDVWNSPPEGYDIARAKQQREKGRETWIYNGGRPWGGAVVIDAPATDSRALIWGCFKHEIPLYFYWHGNHWRHNTQKVGNRIQNVWADTVTFDNRGQPNKPIEDQNFANGDGVLMYPGEERLHPEEDRGIAGPISTIQLANIRRGIQDHLYLATARKLGLTDVVDKALKSTVPRMFSDAGREVGFSEDGDAYENARRDVGHAIARSGGKARTDSASGSGASPEGWKTWAPREEIAPRFSLDPAGGSEGSPALKIEGNGNPGVHGAWTKEIRPVSPGGTYRLTAIYRVVGVAQPGRSISARLIWRDEKGERAGPPDYALDSGSIRDWTRIDHVAKAPEKARSAVVELALAWAPFGTVWWDQVRLAEEPRPRDRVVRAMTIFHRPRNTATSAASVEEFCKIASGAAAQKPDIVCLPEGISLVGTGRTYSEVSEPVPGPTTERLERLARELHSYVVAGILERDGPLVYNTAVLMDRNGAVAGKYRKTHLPYEEVQGGVTPGDSYPVFDTDFGKVGLIICWDVQFPEPARAMAAQGAELLLLPIWGGSEVLARARAIENHAFLVSSSYDMRTFIVDPTGTVLAEANAEHPVAMAEIHLDRQIFQPWLGDMKARTWKERRTDLRVP